VSVDRLQAELGEIRNKLLARLSLDPANHNAIRDHIEKALSDAAALRDQLRDNPKDEHKRRHCLALNAEAAYLASDDEGWLVLWLRKRCVDLTGIMKDTPLLPLTLKAYGPYNYNGDAWNCRISDKKVSRDYKAIVGVLSPDELPPDLVNAWNQPRRGINASSRLRTVGGKQNSGQLRKVSSTTDAKTYERVIRQADGIKMIWLVEKTGSKYKLEGMVADPNIVKVATSQIRQQLAAKRKRRAT